MSENGRLRHRRALVTGASKGIGLAIARRLASEGAAVAITYRCDRTAAVSVVNELQRKGLHAKAFEADLSDATFARRLIDEVGNEFGGIDLLASNAGVEHHGTLASITPELFSHVFAVNVAAQLFLTQAAAEVMSPGGRVVLTSSLSARVASYHHALYAASKAAISSLVLSLAPELAEREIAINAVAPGPTDTAMGREHAQTYTHPALRGVCPTALAASMNALGRAAQPDEIAAAVAFLLSTDASHVTGITLDVAGGWI